LTIIITFIINNNNRCGRSCYYSYFKQQLQVFLAKQNFTSCHEQKQL